MNYNLLADLKIKFSIMRKNALFCLIFFSTMLTIGQTINDVDQNLIYTATYDLNGVKKSAAVSYFDQLGKNLQIQTFDLKTNKIWATQTIHDAHGRPAFQSLSAPVSSTPVFLFKSDFVLNSNGQPYGLADFDVNKENPSYVSSSSSNTLGYYYSSNNTDPQNIDPTFKGNDYLDITVYPFTRTIFSDLNPGSVLRSIGGNKLDTDGNPNTPEEWLNGYSFSMKAGQELAQSPAFNNLTYSNVKIIKTISRDSNGEETVIFSDTDGKTLAAARSGGETSRDMTISIGEQGYVDIHVPANLTGIGGFTIGNNQPGVMTEVYDLITEEVVSGATSSLPNGFYRVSITNLELYDSETNPITIFYKENYYDYSLNEFDEGNRLIASYQPLDKLKSEFQYNAVGHVFYSKSPDEGEAWFKYRADGQVRFSQNSKQALANEFSYTNYDKFGRPVESGVFTENSTYVFDPVNSNALDAILENTFTFEEYENDLDDLPNANCKEQQWTLYDRADVQGLGDAMETLIMGGGPSQRFLTSNVSRTSNENTTTWYSYDIYGRVEWMVQDIAGLGVKTLDYKYDPITGNVLEVDFQKYVPSEHYVHKYTYNLVEELIKVETSSDGINFIEQAEYFYYETGAVRRVELAENLQGIDYVYNLAGQLKSINHPSGQAVDDPGTDDVVTNGFQPDVFSMSLDYYKGDYARTGTPTPIGHVNEGTDQFNGNIKAMTWYTKHPNSTPSSETYYYNYNKNNWLESAGFGAPINGTGSALDTIVKSEVINSNTDLVARQYIILKPGFHVQSGTLFTAKIDPNASGANAGDYNVSNITYDANGNIQSLNRNQHSGTGNNALDQLTYHYKQDKPNQLDHVADAVISATNANDIKTQQAGNYIYNIIGQLVENVEEQIKYLYNASGLVTEVHQNNLPRVKFYYNDKGHRVRKESFNTSGVLSDSEYYIRDATGNIMAIYKNGVQTELPIYGTGRIGVHVKTTNTDYFQLTDHLGNVRAVIAQGSTSPSTSRDYYPFGMPMPGKETIGGEAYRYAFQGQEKDPETGKEAFELRLWDARIGRWLTTDPAGQYNSPYLGMGNNPIIRVDPDGGFDWYKDPDGVIRYDERLTGFGDGSLEALGLSGTYLGATHFEGTTYYSLFGSEYETNTLDGYLAIRIDQSLVDYMQYTIDEMFDTEGGKHQWIDFGGAIDKFNLKLGGRYSFEYEGNIGKFNAITNNDGYILLEDPKTFSGKMPIPGGGQANTVKGTAIFANNNKSYDILNIVFKNKEEYHSFKKRWYNEAVRHNWKLNLLNKTYPLGKL